ncbi:MAG: NADH:ubiquinone oxidoreductase [Chloroflexi bacterium]|nr:NADH:ubiquinone oxidoreductase [Chloroflexota bacterium]
MSPRSVSVYWIQCGGCGGDTMAFLDVESPDVLELLDLLDVEVLWHPSLSNGSPAEHRQLVELLLAGEQQLDVLCIEGAIIRGPGGTGMYDTMFGRPKKDLVAGLARRANIVLAVGTCASFGGIGADGEVEATGAQFLKWEKGGFLGRSFAARSGLPVINLPGCPCHGNVLEGTLSALAAGAPLPLNRYNMPLEWYGMLVHQGCTRNEYHEYRVEEHDFGEKGCLFFHMGCHGPLTYGPCNKLLWNRRSVKTRVGVPCFGCTRPDFPQPHPFFRTRNIEGVPLVVPDGVDRAHYLAYKGMAAAAAPQRLKERQSRV